MKRRYPALFPDGVPGLVLADHVRRNGDVVTLYELALLPAFDRNTVMLMAPYISLEPSTELTGKSYGRTL